MLTAGADRACKNQETHREIPNLVQPLLTKEMRPTLDVRELLRSEAHSGAVYLELLCQRQFELSAGPAGSSEPEISVGTKTSRQQQRSYISVVSPGAGEQQQVVVLLLLLSLHAAQR